MISLLSKASRGSWQSDAMLAGIVGLIAFAARAAVAINVPDSPPVFDMQEYWERAVYIFEHGRLFESGWRTPGYPLALALSFALGSGPSLSTARWLNVFAGTLAALLTYWLARRTANPRPAFIAALIVALYPSFVIYTAFVATETIVTVPLLAALIATSYGTPRSAVATGAFAAVTALVRPAGIALLPAVLVSMAWRRDPVHASANRTWNPVLPTLALVAFALTMTPWWLHNARVHGRFVPLDSGFGVNFFIGNGPLATGLWRSNVFGQLQATVIKGIDWSTPQGSDRLASMTLTHVGEHPLDTLRILPAKITGLLALEGREHAYLYSWEYFGPAQAGTVWLWGLSTLVAFPLLMTAAIAGWIADDGLTPEVRGPCVTFLLMTVAMHVVLFGDSRYHLPLVPVLAVLTTALEHWRTGFRRWRVVAGALLVIWLLGAWSAQWFTFGTVLPKLAAPDGWRARVVYDDLL